MLFSSLFGAQTLGAIEIYTFSASPKIEFFCHQHESALYREVLSHSPTRPLDYEYLKSLTPTSQRFYEIISYQIFATLKYNHLYARMRYSDYCLYSAQIRYENLSAARKQMYKVHQPHRASGYLTDIQFEKGLDRQGRPDWLISYEPGPKARSEYEVFTRKRKPRAAVTPLFDVESTPEPDLSGDEMSESDRRFQQGFTWDLISEVLQKMPQVP